MSAVPPKAEANSRHQRYRALEVIAGTLERRTIDFMGADRIAREVTIQIIIEIMQLLAFALEARSPRARL
jgi:hypothetical protein